MRSKALGIAKVDISKVNNGNLNKSAGLDGHTAAVGRLQEAFCPGITRRQAGLGILSGHVREKWGKDEAVALQKPGKDDSKKGNLRRINLIVHQAQEVEAVFHSSLFGSRCFVGQGALPAVPPRRP